MYRKLTKLKHFFIGITFFAIITGCSDSGAGSSVSKFAQDYGQIIAASVRETIEVDGGGMFLSFAAGTKVNTGLELEEYAVQCTAKIMDFAGGNMPDNVLALVIEYKKDSDIFKNATQIDAVGAMQVSDLVESKIYHCLRAGSIDCCGQQSN